MENALNWVHIIFDVLFVFWIISVERSFSLHKKAINRLGWLIVDKSKDEINQQAKAAQVK